jgi:hypothetical protein
MNSWRKLLDRYLAYSTSLDVLIAPPASEQELALMKQKARDLNVELDPEAVAFLRITNGTGFDSLRVYGANIPDDDELGRFDFVRANLLIEERGRDTLYGEWQDEFFVHDQVNLRFERRSKVTGDSYESYPTYADLLDAVFGEECDLLDERFGKESPR